MKPIGIYLQDNQQSKTQAVKLIQASHQFKKEVRFVQSPAQVQQNISPYQSIVLICCLSSLLGLIRQIKSYDQIESILCIEGQNIKQKEQVLKELNKRNYRQKKSERLKIVKAKEVISSLSQILEQKDLIWRNPRSYYFDNLISSNTLNFRYQNYDIQAPTCSKWGFFTQQKCGFIKNLGLIGLTHFNITLKSSLGHAEQTQIALKSSFNIIDYQLKKSQTVTQILSAFLESRNIQIFYLRWVREGMIGLTYISNGFCQVLKIEIRWQNEVEAKVITNQPLPQTQNKQSKEENEMEKIFEIPDQGNVRQIIEKIGEIAQLLGKKIKLVWIDRVMKCMYKIQSDLIQKNHFFINMQKLPQCFQNSQNCLLVIVAPSSYKLNIQTKLPPEGRAVCILYSGGKKKKIKSHKALYIYTQIGSQHLSKIDKNFIGAKSPNSMVQIETIRKLLSQEIEGDKEKFCSSYKQFCKNNNKLQDYKQFLRSFQNYKKKQCLAIFLYTKLPTLYNFVNDLLRSQNVEQKLILKRYFRLLYDEIECMKLKAVKSFKCYRGGMISQEQANFISLNKGSIVQNLFFMSTSKSYNIASKFAKLGNAIFEIEVQKDSSYAFIQEQSFQKDQEQVLFNPLSSFEIISIEFFSSQYYIKMKDVQYNLA